MISSNADVNTTVCTAQAQLVLREGGGSAGFARGVGGFDPQDRSLTPPAKVGQMYWGVVN